MNSWHVTTSYVKPCGTTGTHTSTPRQEPQKSTNWGRACESLGELSMLRLPYSAAQECFLVTSLVVACWNSILQLPCLHLKTSGDNFETTCHNATTRCKLRLRADSWGSCELQDSFVSHLNSLEEILVARHCDGQILGFRAKSTVEWRWSTRRSPTQFHVFHMRQLLQGKGRNS